MTGGPIAAPFRMYGKILTTEVTQHSQVTAGFTSAPEQRRPGSTLRGWSSRGPAGSHVCRSPRNGDMQGWGYRTERALTNIMKATYAGDVDPPRQGKAGLWRFFSR